MAHKNATDTKRKNSGSETKNNSNINSFNNKSASSNVEVDDGKKKENNNEEKEEFKGRFVGVDETDRAIKSKIHVLKTRCSSEQNLMMKTSTLRKGLKYLSSSLIYDPNSLGEINVDNELVNNPVTKDKPYKQIEINVTVSIDTEDSEEFATNEDVNKALTNNNTEEQDEIDKLDKDLSELRNAVSSGNIYKKNSNVYSVFQAKTLLAERRRSVPFIPKLIGQKMNELNKNDSKMVSKSMDDTILQQSNIRKDFKAKTIRTLSRGLGRLLRRHSSINISEPDPVFKVAYLGNVLTGWAKGEGCVDKPLGTLWRNYNQSSKPDVVMKLSITNSGLKALTKEHGLTEYWAHRITYCCSPVEYPKVFCWVYRHEGRKLKHELRCHAVLCSKDTIAKKIASELQMKIKQALFEFKRDKISRQNARLSLANAVYDNPSLPRRKILLSVGGNNYKPPLERSKSAPKLMAIEELCSEEDEEEEEVPKKPEISTNTWTKEMSTQKMCCKVEDYFPSHTLGRRKCDKRCLKKLSFKLSDDFEPLLNNEKPESNSDTTVDNSIRDFENNLIVNNNLSSTSEIESSHKCSNHVSFDVESSIGSEDSESKYSIQRKISDTSSDNDDVFYCETDDGNKNEGLGDNQNVDSGSQSNYMVLDSDEGSISSGCETASTVTSSDIEMNSLPCDFPQNDYHEKNDEAKERISVLERVQSFEQLFNRERNHSVRNFRSYSRKRVTEGSKYDPFSKGNSDSIKVDTVHPNSDEESLPYTVGSSESEPTSFSDEVNLFPIGENCPRSFLRCVTYTSDDEANASSFDSRDFESSEGRDVCGNLEKEIFEIVDKLGDEKTAGDSDSACSVESGYSEFSENTQSDCIIGQTVMV